MNYLVHSVLSIFFWSTTICSLNSHSDTSLNEQSDVKFLLVKSFGISGCDCAGVLVENGKFLLSAKRNRKPTCTEYTISMDAGNISRSSSTYIGKLRCYIFCLNISFFYRFWMQARKMNVVASFPGIIDQTLLGQSSESMILSLPTMGLLFVLLAELAEDSTQRKCRLRCHQETTP